MESIETKIRNTLTTDLSIKCNILDALRKTPLSIGQIADETKKSRAWISAHVNELAKLGIVELNYDQTIRSKKIAKLLFDEKILDKIQPYTKWKEQHLERDKKRKIFGTQQKVSFSLQTMDELIDYYNRDFEDLIVSQNRQQIIFYTHDKVSVYHDFIPKIESNLEAVSKEHEVIWIAPTKLEVFFDEYRKQDKLKNLYLFFDKGDDVPHFSAVYVHYNHCAVFSNVGVGKRAADVSLDDELALEKYIHYHRFLKLGVNNNEIKPDGFREEKLIGISGRKIEIK